MNPAVRELYAAMLQRELDEVRQLSAGWLARGEYEELFDAVSRFTALAFNPSQHGKHALLAAVATGEIRGELGPSTGPLLTECAVYAASARLPWSEAPLFDPPPADFDRHGSKQAVRAAVAGGDLPSAERWLAANLERETLAADFFRVARETPGDSGGPLQVAVACWKLSRQQDHHPSWPALRPALVEWCASPRGAEVAPGYAGDPREMALALLETLERERGALVVLHEILLLDAHLESVRIVSGEPSPRIELAAAADVVYPLARDFGAFLLAHPVAARLGSRFPDFEPGRMLAACRYNLEQSSWEDWSFG